MGMLVISAGGVVWEPSQTVARLFVAGVQALEQFLGESSGVHPPESDEILLEPDKLEVFIAHLLGRLQHTNNAAIWSLCEGPTALLLALHHRASGHWLPVAEDLQEVAQRAGGALGARGATGSLN